MFPTSILLSISSVFTQVLLVYYCLIISLWHAGSFPGTFAATTRFLGGNETDRLALLAFKAQITSDPLRVMSSWNDSIHFCQWQGVTCSRRHPSRVTVLDLHSQKLTGSLPPHLGNLSFLQVLDLNENNFHHEIPQEIRKLFRLKQLDLGTNSFQGQIPGNISHCSNLIYLGLYSNKLIGPIPAELGSLQNLQQLVIKNNSLTGPIPPSLGNLSSLQIFSATYNSLEGSIPNTIGQLKSLSFFTVGANNLSGTVPPSIYNVSSITVFSLADNHIYGTLPPDLGLNIFPKLESLLVYTNEFTGQIPKSIANASNLIDFLIGENQFTGEVPSFAGMPRLVTIDLAENSLGNRQDKDLDFLSSLVNSTTLEFFAAMDNNFGGALPKSLNNFSVKLTKLGLRGNHIHGTIPAWIGDLTNLEVLGLEQNQLTGTIPSSISKLKSLGSLYLSQNKLSGTIPSSLGNLTSLQGISLDVNNLEGGIPASFANLHYLRFLMLSRNNLNGSIPEGVMNLSSLSEFLDLSRNQLTGPLPIQVGKLTMLSDLDVSGNKLSGEIPNTLGSCTSLISLNMSGNFFQGPIPQSLSSLRGIEDLDLSNNNLSGQIPKYLETLFFLKKVILSNNDFEGEVPIEGVFSNVTAISIAGNKKLCGGMPELHLPICTMQRSNKHRLSTALKVVISVACGLIGITLVASFSYLLIRKRKLVDHSSKSPFDDFILRLSFESLLKATNGFSSANLIGEGSFGSVYKGTLEETNTVIAVKVFHLQFRGASKSFVTECQTLRGIRHRNLVKIITACSSTDFQGNDFKALVYGYMSNGSLEEWLHPVSIADGGPDEPKNLSLSKRLDIAIDVACALNYLHHGCQKPVVHCDLKPSNILIDSEMTACVGDFGLARFLPEITQVSSANQSSTIELKGSIGYVAPEYGMGSEASTSGDAYSYGILLLEMFTGKRPTNDMFKDGLNLNQFTKSAIPGRMTEIVDPILLVEGQNEEITVGVHPNTSEIRSSKIEECLIAVLGVGVACSASGRMDMGSVVVQMYHIRGILLETRTQRGR